ncbi:BTAD domain-containing putative transcriptional regulator [Deinococcus aquatilis]|uniref:BTAD domain-containing putative transcriptional regulator n=1 Tax=Deinococcus aquatilis TaxID=519440 RepID=UPI00037AC385|nr:BTAD domain-containing putative transcriptional regulator [Deinococcus aquatilis]
MGSSSLATPSWYLKLLGGVYLLEGEVHRRIEPRMAAVLAYLALQGATHKYRIAGWLWPDAGETSARANMRQLLRRVRLNLHADFILGTEEIQLNPAVTVDVVELQRCLDHGHYEDALAFKGELLESLIFDDAPDFAEWLESERERVLQVRLRGALRAAASLHASGNAADALLHAHRALTLEPLSEEAHRLVITLNSALGNRGAALQAYERCRAVLLERLGVEPLPETQSLAARIREALPEDTAVKHRPIRLESAALVGRDALLVQMEQAWLQRQTLFLTGEAGIGKTALAVAFAQSKGSFALFQARPGDQHVPYATTSRLVQEMLKLQADLPQRLPTWVAQELARLLPDEFGDVVPAPGSRPDKLQFFNALAYFTDEATRDVAVCVMDDAHYADAATSEFAEFYLQRNRQGGQHTPLWVEVLRSGELKTQAAVTVQQLVNSGRAVSVPVAGLQEADVIPLLEALDAPAQLHAHTAWLHTYTGGHPLYLKEVIEHLITQQLQLPDLAGTPPPKLAQLIDARLSQLSPMGLQVARGAAILNDRAHLHLLARTLDVNVMALAAAWEEVQSAGVLSDDGVMHDLMREGLLRAMPDAIRKLLHLNVAHALTTYGGQGVVIAQHFLAAGQPREAALTYLKAARQMMDLMEFERVISLHDEAASLYDHELEFDLAFEARAQVFHYVWTREEFPAFAAGALLGKLTSSALTREQRAEVALAQATVSATQGAAPQVVSEAVREAKASLWPGESSPLLLALLNVELVAYLDLGELQQADRLAETALAVAATASPCATLASLQVNIARAQLANHKVPQGLSLLRAAGELFAQCGERFGHLSVQTLLALHLERLGMGLEAREVRLQLSAPGSAPSRLSRLTLYNQIRLAINYLHRHEYAMCWKLLHALGTARDEVAEEGVYQRALTDFYWVMGELDACERAAQAALARPTARDEAAQVPWIRIGQVRAQYGDVLGTQHAFDQAAQALNTARGLTYSQALLQLAHSESGLLEPGRALGHAEQAVALAAEHRHASLLTHARTVRARLQFAVGQPLAALTDARTAFAALDTAPPRDDPALPLVTLLGLEQALSGNWSFQQGQMARNWFALLTDPSNVPVQFRAAFLARPSISALEQWSTALPLLA